MKRKRKKKIKNQQLPKVLSTECESPLAGQSERGRFQNTALHTPKHSPHKLAGFAPHPVLWLFGKVSRVTFPEVSVFCNPGRLQLLQAVELSPCGSGSAPGCALGRRWDRELPCPF